MGRGYVRPHLVEESQFETANPAVSSATATARAPLATVGTPSRRTARKPK
ncbi:hypothetical protein [Streptomyces sp. NEAU-YJ-81]|nr:hypothetical protein [Streptomyces sp. NEAU-YJ-81]MBO3675990.1 hypothetical protein [Streptomyces sp. NEAU-YJ-81]